MITPTTTELSFDSLRAHSFSMARQPILDRNQRLVAYELLFHRAENGGANITTDLSTTTSVIAHTSHIA